MQWMIKLYFFKLQTVKEILLWLGINKVQNFYLEVCPNIDAKLFTKESDGSWKVAKSPQGSRLTPFDTLLEVNGHRVKGLTSEQLTKLVKDSKGCPNVRVHRKTRSKKQMYEALRLPPPTTKITLWDMDLCLLRVHTGGHTNEKLQHLSKQVTEAYVYLMDIMIAKGYKTGVVTFSDKLVAKSVGVPYGGEELVRPLVFHALRRHWMAQDRTLKLADAIARARNYVENELYVRAAYPEWRNNNVEEWKRTPMPNSKEWHVTRIKEDFEAKTKQKIQNKEVVLFDDGKRNIEEAVKSGVVAVLVNEEIGFTVKDWEEAMDTAWTQHLKSNSKA